MPQQCECGGEIVLSTYDAANDAEDKYRQSMCRACGKVYSIAPALYFTQQRQWKQEGLDPECEVS